MPTTIRDAYFFELLKDAANGTCEQFGFSINRRLIPPEHPTTRRSVPEEAKVSLRLIATKCHNGRVSPRGGFNLLLAPGSLGLPLCLRSA